MSANTHIKREFLDSSTDAPRKEPERLRRRGGQLGNINALRHGAYARDLDLSPSEQFRQVEMRSLLTRAARLKDYMQKIYTENFDSTDPATLLFTLRALTKAGSSLSNLVQRYYLLHTTGKSADTFSALFSSLDAAAEHSQDLDR